MIETEGKIWEQTDFENLEWLAQQVVEGFIIGLHKSPFHGFSVEFAEHRLYNNGDSVKNIDWKLFARSDKLFVKRFEEETNLRCQILIDHSSSMFYPEKGINKFQFSTLATAALIQLLKKQRDAFGVTLFAEDIQLHTPTKSTLAHQKFILNELEKEIKRKPTNKKTQISENLHLIAEQIHKRSLVVIFSDLLENTYSEKGLDELFAALQHLKFNKHEIIIFNVNEKKHELDFDFENRPYHFVDPESGEDIKMRPHDLKAVYLDKMNTFKKEFELKCAQFKIELVHAHLEDGFYPVLHSWLVKKNKMT